MTAADLARVDVPLPELIRNIDELLALKKARMATGLLSEERHQCDPVDGLFASLACEHPEKCSRAADYPGWTPGGAA